MPIQRLWSGYGTIWRCALAPEGSVIVRDVGLGARSRGVFQAAPGRPRRRMLMGLRRNGMLLRRSGLRGHGLRGGSAAAQSSRHDVSGRLWRHVRHRPRFGRSSSRRGSTTRDLSREPVVTPEPWGSCAHSNEIDLRRVRVRWRRHGVTASNERSQENRGAVAAPAFVRAFGESAYSPLISPRAKMDAT
jgi:hypothetical protein